MWPSPSALGFSVQCALCRGGHHPPKGLGWQQGAGVGEGFHYPWVTADSGMEAACPGNAVGAERRFLQAVYAAAMGSQSSVL